MIIIGTRTTINIYHFGFSLPGSVSVLFELIKYDLVAVSIGICLKRDPSLLRIRNND